MPAGPVQPSLLAWHPRLRLVLHALHVLDREPGWLPEPMEDLEQGLHAQLERRGRLDEPFVQRSAPLVRDLVGATLGAALVALGR